LGIAVGPLYLTEQLAGLAFPRKASELIDRRNQEGRQAAVDGFVDRNNRQRRPAGEFAISIYAGDAQIERLFFDWDEIERVGRKLRSVPRADFERNRGGLLGTSIVFANSAVAVGSRRTK
jgi:hypothetical protein